LYIHGAIEDFHTLHSLINIYTEESAVLGVKRGVWGYDLQGIATVRRQRVKSGITLAKVHVIDFAALRSQLQGCEVE
jgi:hypothetical protein